MATKFNGLFVLEWKANNEKPYYYPAPDYCCHPVGAWCSLRFCLLCPSSALSLLFSACQGRPHSRPAPFQPCLQGQWVIFSSFSLLPALLTVLLLSCLFSPKLRLFTLNPRKITSDRVFRPLWEVSLFTMTLQICSTLCVSKTFVHL